METREYKVYKYDELTEEQQQKVLENYAYINVEHEWWDSTYEDAKTAGIKITAFDLDRNRHCSGEFIETAEATVAAILKEHGKKCETYKTAIAYIPERAKLVNKYIDDDDENVFVEKCNEMDAEFLRSILEDYSIMLQKEYEYMSSEKAIIETLEANDYDFTEDGKID